MYSRISSLCQSLLSNGYRYNGLLYRSIKSTLSCLNNKLYCFEQTCTLGYIHIKHSVTITHHRIGTDSLLQINEPLENWYFIWYDIRYDIYALSVLAPIAILWQFNKWDCVDRHVLWTLPNKAVSYSWHSWSDIYGALGQQDLRIIVSNKDDSYLSSMRSVSCPSCSKIYRYHHRRI